VSGYQRAGGDLHVRDGFVQNGDDGHAEGPDLEGEESDIFSSGLATFIGEL
jgi:hypothetical protein